MLLVKHAQGVLFNSKYDLLLLDNEGKLAGFVIKAQPGKGWEPEACARSLRKGFWLPVTDAHLIDHSHGVLRNIDPKVDVHYQDGAAFVTVVVPADKARHAHEVLTSLLSDNPLLTAVKAAYESGGRVPAIRKCSELTGWHLVDAKHWVDDHFGSTTNDA